MAIKIAITVIVFIICTTLFKLAGESLSLTKLNMVSYIYFYFIAFNLLGGSLIYLGLRDHYLIQRVRNANTIDTTYGFLAYTAVVFPLVLLVVKKVIQTINNRNVKGFISSPTYYNGNRKNTQAVVVLLTFICMLSIVYVFFKMGFIPVLELFRGRDLNLLRQMASRFFPGNQYIKNVVMLQLTPMLSYYAYIHFRVEKGKTWTVLFLVLALSSVVAVTYDFAKSPIITYIIGFYLIECILGNIRNKKRFYTLAIAVVVIIIFLYVGVMGYSDSLLNIYRGPIGRVLFTQIATLFLHVEAFPLRHPFLHGASFNSWMSFIVPNAEGLRSGRVVMTIYNAAGVENQTAGVMNTLFIGEAYANFGKAGVIIAPILFGIIIGIFAYVLPGMKKRPSVVLLYVEMTLLFVTIVEGGFIDIIYNFTSIFYVVMFICIDFFTGGAKYATSSNAFSKEKLLRVTK